MKRFIIKIAKFGLFGGDKVMILGDCKKNKKVNLFNVDTNEKYFSVPCNLIKKIK